MSSNYLFTVLPVQQGIKQVHNLKHVNSPTYRLFPWGITGNNYSPLIEA